MTRAGMESCPTDTPVPSDKAVATRKGIRACIVAPSGALGAEHLVELPEEIFALQGPDSGLLRVRVRLDQQHLFLGRLFLALQVGQRLRQLLIGGVHAGPGLAHPGLEVLETLLALAEVVLQVLLNDLRQREQGLKDLEARMRQTRSGVDAADQQLTQALADLQRQKEATQKEMLLIQANTDAEKAAIGALQGEDLFRKFDQVFGTQGT